MTWDLFTPRASGEESVLFVCTGNICRSPLAEILLRNQLNPETGISVGSAGLHAVVGAPMDTLPAEIARQSGADPAHRARQISADLAGTSGLILTMTGSQRSQVLQRFPTALRRTFTFSEFIQFLEAHSATATTLTALVALAADSRRPDASALTDIEDPYRRSEATHARVGARISSLTTALSRALNSLPR